MTPEKWKRLKELFDAAIDLSKEQQARYIGDQSGEDAEVRQELIRMLEATEDGTGPLQEPIFDIHNFATFAEKPLPDGTVLLNRFRIVRLLGSGGMGDVYEAVDLLLDPGRIALKVIRSALARNPQILSRFKQELILARHVTGPNVCRVHELYIPEPGSGCPCAAFLTMEFLGGETLSSRIRPGEPMPLKQASEIAQQICSALQTIHDAQVVHRDLKPQNIMLVRHNGGEKVVLMDFGVAVGLTASREGNSGLTSPGAIVGTPDYMAPEQFDGKEATTATDVYALGIILYELFTGKHPFVAETSMGAAVSRGRYPDSASSVRHGTPAAWDHVIAKCLNYEPEKRFASAAQVQASLGEHSLVLWKTRSGQRVALSRRMALLTGTVFVFTLAGFSWHVYRTFELHRPPLEAQEWYDRAAVALREGTYLLATKEFKMALDRDPNFSLARGRLAEALAELDFEGKAEQEMLIATSPEQMRSVTNEDKRYLEAIRNTLIRNYSAAVQNYETILHDLPGKEKGHGYVDLGRAYEKAGRIKETIASYRKAAQLMPDDPAPFVHLGIWESRQRDPAAADTAFTKAEKLYAASGNMEGLAEVTYQRGYAANEAADSVQARQFLDKSLEIARQIPNVQLEVRTLTQLSSVAYNDTDLPGADDKAIELANKAIQLARENDLEYWSTDGFVRLANAYLDKGDLASAESYAQAALRSARQNQHPRLEASASLTVASIRDRQRNNPDEQISYAQTALKYYRDFGFMNAAAQSNILMLRAQELQGQYLKASQAGNELLQTAQKTGSQLVVESAEDVLGDAAAGLENHPAALTHFEGALKASRSLHQDEAYQEVDCADALWSLGKYTEAVAMLASASAHSNARRDVEERVDEVRAQMLLSQDRFIDALAIAKRGKLQFADLPKEQTFNFGRAEVLAEASLGQLEKAQRDAEHLVDIAKASGRQDILMRAQLTAAQVYVNAHLPEKAIPLATAATNYGLSQGQKESAWLALSCLAHAYKQTGNNAATRENAKKAIDILNDLEQSWGSSVFHLYSSRPDLRVKLHDLTMLSIAQ